MRTIYLDGQYLKVNPQIIKAFTPGVFKAKGVFETMLGINGELIDTDLHFKRLRAGLKFLGIRLPAINPSVLRQVLRRNHLICARVRLMVWQEHVMVVALPYKVSQKAIYRVGLVKTSRPANKRLADVKSLDYELFAKAYSSARTQGLDEVLLLNRHGYIFEASRANIFWVKDKVLYTPPLSSGCLNGITRQQVIKQAKDLKITVKEKNLTPEILKKADGAFITNSLLGIQSISPVTKPGLRN